MSLLAPVISETELRPAMTRLISSHSWANQVAWDVQIHVILMEPHFVDGLAIQNRSEAS